MALEENSALGGPVEPKVEGGLRTAAAKGMKWSALGNVGRQALAFAVFAVLARLISRDAFGVVAAAAVYVAFVELFVSQGLGSAIVQRETLERSHLDTAFWLQMVIGALAAVVTVVVAGPASKLLNEPRVVPVLRWLSLKFVFMGLSSVQVALLSRELRFRTLALRTLLGMSVGGATGLTMAFMGYGIWALVAQQLVGDAAGAVFMWGTSSWVPGLRISFARLKDFMGISTSVLGGQLMMALSGRLDQLLVEPKLGSAALGEYSLAGRVVGLMGSAILTPMNAVAFPLFSRLQGEKERLKDALYKAVAFNSVVALPTYSGMAILSTELVRVGFGGQWVEAGPALRYVALSSVVGSVFTFCWTVHLSAGKPWIALCMQALGLAGTVVATLIGLRWGIQGVAIGTVFTSALCAMGWLGCMRLVLHISVARYLSSAARPVGASLVMLCAVLPIRVFMAKWGAMAILAVCVPAGVIVYLIVMSLLAPQIVRELLTLVRAAIAGQRNREAMWAPRVAIEGDEGAERSAALQLGVVSAPEYCGVRPCAGEGAAFVDDDGRISTQPARMPTE